MTLIVATGVGCGNGLSMVKERGLSDPSVLAVYNDDILTAQDFKENYLRTVGDADSVFMSSDSLLEYQDFLERYVDFRLKVLKATSLGYRDDPGIHAELLNYRVAFARPYLIDQEIMLPIASDLYQKKKEMIEASHILIRVEEDAMAQDTILAHARITAYRDSVLEGADFGDIAYRYSQDRSARNATARQGYRGHLGTFSGGRMVKAFEDAVYKTPVGEVSPVFRSPYGYHITFVHSRNPATLPISVAHIMVRLSDATHEDSVAALKKIEDVKILLNEGAEWAPTALEYSEDQYTAESGGSLGQMKYDNFSMDQAFHQAAFALKNIDDISDVVESAYGYHIIRLTDRHEHGTFEEEYPTLKREVSRLPRVLKAEQRLADEARLHIPASVDTTRLTNLVADVTRRDSAKIHLVATAEQDSAASSMPIATLGDSTYTLRQLAVFIKKPGNNIRNRETASDQILEYADAFLDHAAVTHTALQLEKTDDEFASIMQNFVDGLVLFKLMEDSVWTPAAEDSALQQVHFDANKDKYQFPDRQRIIEIYSHSDSLLQDAVARLDSGMTWTEFETFVTQDSVRKILMDTILVEGPTRSIYDRALDLPRGERTEILSYRRGSIILMNNGIEPSRPKTLDESRASVINELQAILEKRLLDRLRSEYRVMTYPERLPSALVN